MNFELKNVETIGGVKTVNETTSSQLLQVTVGVVGCPYTDIMVKKMITYEFDNLISVADARAGIKTFAAAYVASNYPNA